MGTLFAGLSLSLGGSCPDSTGTACLLFPPTLPSPTKPRALLLRRYCVHVSLLYLLSPHTASTSACSFMYSGNTTRTDESGESQCRPGARDLPYRPGSRLPLLGPRPTLHLSHVLIHSRVWGMGASSVAVRDTAGSRRSAPLLSPAGGRCQLLSVTVRAVETGL